MPEGLRPYHRGRVQAYPTADAQTFVPGRVVTNTAGEVTDGGATPTTDIFGVTLDPAEWPEGMPALTQGVIPNEGQLTLIALAGSNRTFVGYLTTGQSVAATMIGAAADIAEVDGLHRINTATPGAVAFITELVDPPGTAEGRVVIRFQGVAITPYAE